MLNRKTISPLPTVCMVALFAIVVIGLSNTQVAGQNASPDHIQGLRIVPGQCPGSCGPCCQPNFRYWGYWPTVWRQWPQARPDIWFPQGNGIEQLPTPQGVKAEPLPKEEPFVPPGAQQPGGIYVPPISEGPATGPGGDDGTTPFQLDSGFDQGPGFDQGLPGMENLPSQPPLPETMPIEGTNNSGAAPPMIPPAALTPPEEPPKTDTAPAMPAPDKNSAISVPEELNPLVPHAEQQVVRTESQLPQAEPAKEIAQTPIPIVRTPFTPAPMTTAPMTQDPIAPEPMTAAPITQGPIAPQPMSMAPIAAGSIAPGPIAPDIAPEPMTSAPIAPEPMDSRSYMEEPAVGKPIAEIEQPVVEPIRQTTFEAPIASQSTAPPEPEGLHKHSKAPLRVGLDGYCPVDLVRNEAWTMGDSRFAVEYEGRVYQMCGPEQHRAFRSNPERYAPANAGNDPVLSFEENSLQAGRTDACAVFEGRLYMFVDADSLARFQTNPQRYTRALYGSSK